MPARGAAPLNDGAAAPRLDGQPVPRHGGGPPPPGRIAPPVGNGRIAIVMLIAAETMLFTGLIGAYVVLRGTSGPWPPLGQPRLPLAITWANTGLLLLSCWTMSRAVAALRAGHVRRLRLALVETGLLGSAFLGVQGSEWVRLLNHGLTLSTGLYGATFYLLIGLHGAHVAAAVTWLLWLLARSGGGRFTLKRAAGVDLCAIYWYFVCALWAVLFPLVYLL